MLQTLFGWIATRVDALRATSERGASAVEYGLLVGLIAVAIIVSVAALGSRLDEMFCSVVSVLPFGTASCP